MMKKINIFVGIILLFCIIAYTIWIFAGVNPKNYVLYDKETNTWNTIKINFPHKKLGDCASFTMTIDAPSSKDMNTFISEYQQKVQEEMEKNLMIQEKMDTGSISSSDSNIYVYKENLRNGVARINVPHICDDIKKEVVIFFNGNLDISRIPGDIYIYQENK